MLSRFFVNRPIFAWVIAITIMLAGVLAIFNLPVSQYPNIAPPQVRVTATYPGASAETMSRTVTQVIEQNMTGLDGLIYMSSNSDSTGRMTITLTFVAGTDPDIAQVQVQNKLSMAEPTLPDTVRQLGVQVQKSSASFLQVVGFIDTSGKLTSGDLGDFLTNNIEEPLARLEGVGEVTVFGASYAMRIWMDPALLVKYGLEVSDVMSAISTQNVQVASGDIAGQPTNGKRMITATIRASSLLTTPEQFEQIALKTLPDGSVIRLTRSSQLNYPASFDDGNRTVHLTGEAFFEVSKRNGAPFTVTTVHDAEVVVRGTKFNLKAYDDSSDVETVLVEGAVDFRAADHVMALHPGQKVSYNPTDNDLTLQTVNVEAELAARLRTFRHVDLAQIAGVIEDFYGIGVAFRSEALKNIQFTGTLDFNMPIDHILEVLTLSTNTRFNRNGEKITIHK